MQYLNYEVDSQTRVLTAPCGCYAHDEGEPLAGHPFCDQSPADLIEAEAAGKVERELHDSAWRWVMPAPEGLYKTDGDGGDVYSDETKAHCGFGVVLHISWAEGRMGHEGIWFPSRESIFVKEYSGLDAEDLGGDKVDLSPPAAQYASTGTIEELG